MDRLEKFLRKAMEANPFTEQSSEAERAQWRVEQYNKQEGKLTGYDCQICHNKGNIMFLDEHLCEYVKRCSCMDIRRSIKLIEKSGLKDLMDRYTFENFTTATVWQAKAKKIAFDYAQSHEDRWFFAGGQVGSGKTHLCTAIVGELLRSGLEAKYMLWRDEIVPLKAQILDDEYSEEVSRLKNVKVLYIDDFLKTERGKFPTTAEINIAFEVINYRYNRQDLITVISSEFLLDEIIDIDEAVGSRIYQRASGHCINIGRDKKKN